jgi:hypothetical protein
LFLLQVLILLMDSSILVGVPLFCAFPLSVKVATNSFKVGSCLLFYVILY